MNFRIASGVDRTLRLVNFSAIHVSILRPQIKIFTEYIKSPSEPLTRNTVGGNNHKKIKTKQQLNGVYDFIMLF